MNEVIFVKRLFLLLLPMLLCLMCLSSCGKDSETLKETENNDKQEDASSVEQNGEDAINENELQIQGEEGTIQWTINNGVLTILGHGVVEGEPWLEHPEVNVSMITELVIGDEITDFSYSSFGNYEALATVDLGDGFTYIPPEEFIGCTSLKEFRFGENVTFIDGGAFERCGFKELVIPDSITFINIGAFANCTELERITIPTSVTEIGEGAFDGCDKLTIYGISGSYAESYANANGIAFSEM